MDKFGRSLCLIEVVEHTNKGNKLRQGTLGVLAGFKITEINLNVSSNRGKQEHQAGCKRSVTSDNPIQ